MKKRNKFGLVGKVLVGALAIGTLFPSFANGQEKLPTKQIQPEETNIILKKELGIDAKKNISLSEAKTLYSNQSSVKSSIN